MHENDKTIADSYRFCRRVSRRAGSNFLAGFLLLPKHKRRAMWALYAFMRHSDDLVDSPAESPAEALAAWRAAVQRTLVGWVERSEPHLLENSPVSPPPSPFSPLRDAGGACCARPTLHSQTSNSPHPSPLPMGEGPGVRADERGEGREERGEGRQLSSPTDILPALADAVRRFNIPHEHLFAVLDGMEMDLRPRSYRTFAELEEYCHRAASAVGLSCIHVWGFDGPAAFEPARQAGVALQLTNILRDLGEDAATGRVYLPLEDFSFVGYSVDELRRGVINDGFLRLMQLEIARARRYYDAAGELMNHLSRDGRRIHGVLMDTYRRLLDKIERSPAEVLRRRISLGRFEKLCIVARHALTSGRQPTPLSRKRERGRG